MKYVPPFGEADPNASYKDRNTGAGQPGSKVPAKAIENPQREIQEVIVQAGLTPSSESVTQLYDAILLLIAQITGEGENPLNDLLDLLRARLPIYPEILSVNGKINFSTPSAGVVRLPSGIQLRHRGCFNETTTEQDFNTTALKTYHLRKRWTGGSPGWSLVDVSDSGYNPGALSEATGSFDTTYDDMLAARVITNASNVASITSLVNKHELTINEILSQTSYATDGVGSDRFTFLREYNWARTPSTHSLNVARATRDSDSIDNDFAIRPSGASLSDLLNLSPAFDVTRYRVSQSVLRDWTTTLDMHFSARA